jgi:hypothetical protein
MTAWRRRALGNEWVRRAYANKTAFNEEFQELITRYARAGRGRITTNAPIAY